MRDSPVDQLMRMALVALPLVVIFMVRIAVLALIGPPSAADGGPERSRKWSSGCFRRNANAVRTLGAKQNDNRHHDEHVVLAAPRADVQLSRKPAAMIDGRNCLEPGEVAFGFQYHGIGRAKF